MFISGTVYPVVNCLLLYIIQRGNYNYILGRRLLQTGVFFYLVPVQLVKYLLPKDALPETKLIGRKADSYLSGSLAFWSENQDAEENSLETQSSDGKIQWYMGHRSHLESDNR